MSFPNRTVSCRALLSGVAYSSDDPIRSKASLPSTSSNSFQSTSSSDYTPSGPNTLSSRQESPIRGRPLPRSLLTDFAWRGRTTSSSAELRGTLEQQWTSRGLSAEPAYSVSGYWSEKIMVARLPKVLSGHVFPVEIVEHIFAYLSPRDFNAARHTCRVWMTAGVSRKLLTNKLKFAGWWQAVEADLSGNEEIGMRKSPIHTDWLLSKRLSTECSLRPGWTGDGFSVLAPATCLSYSDTAQRCMAIGSSPHQILTPTFHIDFSALSQGNWDDDPTLQYAYQHWTDLSSLELDDDDAWAEWPVQPYDPRDFSPRVRQHFTVSVCGKFVLVIYGCDMYIFALGDMTLSGSIHRGGQLQYLTTITCENYVLAASIDSSCGKLGVVALLEGENPFIHDHPDLLRFLNRIGCYPGEYCWKDKTLLRSFTSWSPLHHKPWGDLCIPDTVHNFTTPQGDVELSTTFYTTDRMAARTYACRGWPISDGVHVLYTDKNSEDVCMRCSPLSESRPKKLVLVTPRRIQESRRVLSSWGLASAPPPTYLYAAGSDLRWGVRIAVAYGDSVWLYCVSSDLWSTINDMGEDSSPLSIEGREIGRVKALENLAVDASGGGVTIWAFGVDGNACCWEMDHQGRKSRKDKVVLVDRSVVDAGDADAGAADAGDGDAKDDDAEDDDARDGGAGDGDAADGDPVDSHAGNADTHVDDVDLPPPNAKPTYI